MQRVNSLLRRLWLFLLLGLTACFGAPPPVQLDFATSLAIFRGTYQTEVDMRVSSPDVDLNPDSTVLAMANGDYFHAVQFWDVESATPLGTVEAGFAVASVTMSPDGKRVAAFLPSYESHLPGSGRVWDVASGEVRLSTSCPLTPQPAQPASPAA